MNAVIDFVKENQPYLNGLNHVDTANIETLTVSHCQPPMAQPLYDGELHWNLALCRDNERRPILCDSLKSRATRLAETFLAKIAPLQTSTTELSKTMKFE